MTRFSVRAHESYAAEASSVALARRFTRRTLAEWGLEELVDTAALVVSELVTNAVVHAGTPAVLGLALEGRALRIEVEDRHPGRELPLAPLDPAEVAENGRGLLIATSLATAWGVEYTATSKRVWALCERDGTGRAASVSVPRTPGRARVVVVEVSASGDVTRWGADAESVLGWSADEVRGRPYADLVEPSPEGPPAGRPALPVGWLGGYALRCRDGSTEPVFASHVLADDDGRDGLVVLAVPEEQRGLIEHPPAPEPNPDPGHTAVLGLRDDALLRLGVEEYLMLAVERVRDPVAADATYLLLAHDFLDELEVVAVSGLPEELLGTRLVAGSPGTPDARGLRRPVVVPDLREVGVPLLAGTSLRSLLVVPLVMEGKLVGALAAAAAVPHGFSDDQAGLLQRLGDTIAVTVDRARLQASERERRMWLSYIADAGDLLAGSLEPDMTMAITGQIVVPRIAQWCAIHLTDERGAPALQQVWHEDEQLAEDVRDAVARWPGQAVLEGTAALAPYAVSSIALVARGRTIGFLTLGRPAGEPLRSDLYTVAQSIARRAALAIDNARAHRDLRATGRALQESLLPPTMPTVPGLDIGVVYEAAGEGTEAGGDFYDVFPVAKGAWCFVVGDVCGTGAEAAAVTGLARHTIQALVRAGLPVPATLERLNTAILDEGARGRFLTLVCGTLRVSGGQVQLDLVDAGHPPPLLVRADGEVLELGTPQTLLGVVEHTAYTSEHHVLARGDLLVVVTDGVLERRDGGRMLGEDGLVAALAGVEGLPAQEVASRIRQLVADFTAVPQRDDIAILTLRLARGAEPVSGR
jgi:serine phosphatase RsbU (regulator of sigma subunit)/anti-sigma regulatory factor (Ser/Thr protein kinase)